MNTKLLKQKILDLAIRGKLTQQLKSDGTAADLLTQISGERRKTRGERKGTRSKKSGVILSEAQSAKSKDLGQIIPLDKSEAPFEIPANWEWVRLGDLMSKVGAGSTPTGGRNVYESSGVKFIRSQNVYNEGLHLEDVVYINESIHKQKQNSKVVGNDLLLNITGASIGRCAIVPNDFDEANINQHVLILRLLNFDLLKYIHLAITSRFVFRQIMGVQVGGTKEGLSAERAKELQIPLPPLAEQQRIVAKIEEAFAEIDAIEKNKELLKTHIKQTRQKILDLAIHGKLVPQNKSDEPASVLLERITRDNPHYEKIEDEPFEIPENWAWCRLRNLSESIQYGYNAPAKDFGRIKMVRISDIHENEVEWDSVPYCDIDDKEIQTYLLKKNDILFARTGGTVGKSFIVSNLPEDAVYAGYLIRTRYGKNANAQYMKYFMESNLYWEQLRDGCIATAQPNCNGKTLGKMQIPLPPLNEQSRIVAKIEELFSTLDQMERNLV